MNTLIQQLHRNLLSIISLTVALSALAYNTYRNELTEDNRNIRFAGFELLKELTQLQLLIDYAHYDNDHARGNPITGWNHVIYVNDMSALISESTVAAAEELEQVWSEEWQNVAIERSSNQRVSGSIDALRSSVRQTMRSLD